MEITETTGNSQERESNALIPGAIIIMDVSALPRERFDMDTDKWAYIIREHGILFYDGQGETPKVIPLEDKEIKVEIIEYNEETKEKYKDLLDDI